MLLENYYGMKYVLPYFRRAFIAAAMIAGFRQAQNETRVHIVRLVWRRHGANKVENVIEIVIHLYVFFLVDKRN